MYITDSNGNYIPTTTIKGEDGKEVSLRISADYIQWRREDTDWANLIALDALVGPSGKKVLLNAVGYILQYKYDGDADWITLCDLSTYFGNTAAATAAAAANAAADRANAAAALCEDVAAGAIPSHASSHGTGGSDPITPASIGAVSEQDMNGLAEHVDNIALGLENHTHTPASIGAAAAVSRLAPAGGTVNLTVADNTEYRFSSTVTSLTITFPSGNFDCWLKFTTGSSITVSLPASATYIGGVPTFDASKTYEMSIKDGVVLCAEVTTE